MFELEHIQVESDVVAGSGDTRKRKHQIEVNSPSPARVKKFRRNGMEIFKWNGTTVYPSDEISNGDNHLASTQRWRKLLFNKKDKLLVKSDNFFRNGVNVLLYGIDKCAGNPAQWSREDTNCFYLKFTTFFSCWKWWVLRKSKRGWVTNDTNELNLITSVYQESLKFIMFSEDQKRTIDSNFKELTDLKDTFLSTGTQLKINDQELNEAKEQADDGNAEKLKRSSFETPPTNNPPTQVDHPQVMLDGCLQDMEKQRTINSKFKELNDLKDTFLSTETQLKINDQELNEAKEQADDNAEKLKRSSFETLPTNNPLTQVDHPQVMLDGCLRDKEKQLNELKKLLNCGAKKQKETEAELTETREQLKSFVAKSREMAQTKQKDTIKKLSEIQAFLLTISPNYRSSCQTKNESLNNKEEKLFQDIKALIECTMQSVGSAINCKRNTTESALETNSSSASLRVSEYEMHLVTQIAAYLKVTPFPVSSHSVYSYLVNIDNIVDLQFVESLLRKFPSFFKEVADAPGSMDKKWIYLDLKPVITI